MQNCEDQLITCVLTLFYYPHREIFLSKIHLFSVTIQNRIKYVILQSRYFNQNEHQLNLSITQYLCCTDPSSYSLKLTNKKPKTKQTNTLNTSHCVALKLCSTCLLVDPGGLNIFILLSEQYKQGPTHQKIAQQHHSGSITKNLTGHIFTMCHK